MQLERSLRRYQNALRRVLAGLRLRAENVSPDCPNDLFRAHESIYAFASTFLDSGRALDLGCGTGYGSARLLAAGAEEVVGVDLDPRNIRYARRRFGTGGLPFQVENAEDLPDSLGRFDLIVASNVLEHLVDVERGFSGILRCLGCEGTLVAVVPPILDAAGLKENERNPFHRTNLFVGEWRSRFTEHFRLIRAFRHLPPPGHTLDFTDPCPSAVAAEDFRFLEVEVEDLGQEPTLGAVFVCRP